MTQWWQPLVVALLWVSLTTISVGGDEPGGLQLRAGAARVDISPRTLPALMNGGFLQASRDQVADPLHARALVLSDGRETLAVVIVDSCMLPRDVCDAIKRQASTATGIRTDRILIAATHTHTAPSAMAMCLGCGRDEPYVSLVTTQVARAIEKAAASLRAAKVGWAIVEAADLTHCRRWITRSDTLGTDPFGGQTVRAMMHPGYQNPNYTSPAGPVDPWLSVLSVVDAADNEPLCLLGNLSMHYFGSGGGFSADYFGEVASILERRLGGRGERGLVGIMSQGTSGDLHWMNYALPQKNLSRHDYAVDVADRIAEACQRIEHRGDHALAAAETRIALRRRQPSPERLSWAASLNSQRGELPPRNQPEVYAQQAAWIDQHPQEELVLQAFRIGGLGITAIPCEVYGITGLKLKRQSPLEATLNFELANGAAGYIPPPEQHLLGGYTTWPARTAGLEVQAEPQIVEAVLQLLEEVAGTSRKHPPITSNDYAHGVMQRKPTAYWQLTETEAGVLRNTAASGVAQHQGGVALFLPGPAGAGFATGETYGNRAVYLAGGYLEATLKTLPVDATVSLWICNQLPSDARDETGAVLSMDTVAVTLTGLAAGGRAGVLELSVAGRSAYGTTPLSRGAWHHLTLTRDRQEVRLYLDGRVEPEATLPAPLPPPSGRLLIGSGEPQQPTFDGLVDDVAVFPRCLAADEIAALYHDSGMSPPRPPRRAVVLPAKPAAAAARDRYAEAVLASRPQHYWRLHESLGEPPRDAAATEITAAAGMKVTFEPRVTGWSGDGQANFSGGRLAGSGELAANSSVEFWFRNDLAITSRPVTAYLFSRGVAGVEGATGDNLGLGGTHSHSGKLFVFTGNEDNQLAAGQTPLLADSWSHVVFVREGDRVRVYLNGDIEPEIDVCLPSVVPEGCTDFFFGGRSDAFAHLQGAIEEIAVYDRPLSPAEVQTHFRAAGVEPVVAEDVGFESRLQAPLPTDPSAAVEAIEVRDGYCVELVAAEPLVQDPVAIDWGGDGMLWVAEMADYPLGIDGKGQPGGRVRCLRDTDGDGRYDRSTVFAEGLRFPSGVMVWRNGVLVTAAPEILFLADTDGDGRADVREPLFTGFLEGNQQLRVNGLRWGLDNWVYCASGSHHAGYGSESEILSHRTGQRLAVGSRDFRIRPESGELDPQTGPSQYGRNRDDWGNWFGVQNSHPLWHNVLADHDIRRNPHYAPPDPRWQVVRPANPPVYPASTLQKRYHSFEQSGRFTSACSAMVYRDSLLFPRGRQQHAFTCEPFHNLVQHNLLEPRGVTFDSRRDPAEDGLDFFASRDRWCRPVMARTGPDGALWVVDMYRFMIEHPDWLPAVGKEELRPWFRAGSDRGRIYRITRCDKKPPEVPRLRGDDPDACLVALEHSNGPLRDLAQRLLVQRGETDVVAPLVRLVATHPQPFTRLQALCTLDGLASLSDATLQIAVADAHPGVRRQAVRLATGRPTLLPSLTELVADPAAPVRLQLATTLGSFASQEAAQSLAALLTQPDPEGFLVAAAMTSLTAENVADVVTALAAAEVSDKRGVEPVLAAVMGQAVAMGDAATMDCVVQLACRRGDIGQAMLAGVLDAFEKRGVTTASLSAEARQHVVEQVQQARQVAKAAERSTPQRVAAVTLLARDSSQLSVDGRVLEQLLLPQTALPLQQAVVAHLATRPYPEVADLVLAGWPSHSPRLRGEIVEMLLSRAGWRERLQAAVGSGVVGASDLSAAVRQRLVAEESEAAAWQEALAASQDTVPAGPRAAVLQSYQTALELPADVRRGELHFRKLCLSCHTLADEGHAVGPHLGSVTDKSREALFTAVLHPNAAVEATYLNYLVLTTDGRQFAGRLVSETASSITLLASGGVQHTVLRGEIDTLQASTQSVMPEGLEQDLTPQDLADVIAFVQTAFTAEATSP